ncbi:hypothetical protein AVEN_169616-1 [Araneus ventricosus]|uniref:Uncharacterized protein n=1 Tax=Araneus ventricosus TaxID=182803 RepID=A0A4Y2KLP4_ARAVE|nr:hypothetical protein AVEN_169616-1 [Araneus ventricosus]
MTGLKAHVSAFGRLGFIAVVIRSAEQRLVEYRPKTHTELQLPVGTVLSSLSTSFDLRIIYRCFPRMLQPSHKPSGYWNQDHTSLVLYWNRVPLPCKVEPQYSLRFLLVSKALGKTEGIASLCAGRVRFL